MDAVCRSKQLELPLPFWERVGERALVSTRHSYAPLPQPFSQREKGADSISACRLSRSDYYPSILQRSLDDNVRLVAMNDNAALRVCGKRLDCGYQAFNRHAGEAFQAARISTFA